MNFNIETNKLNLLIYYIIFLVVFLYVIISCNNMDFIQWIKVLAIAIVFHLVITFSVLKISGVKLISVSGMFLFLVYVFHLGQVVLKGIFLDYRFNYDVSMIVSQDIYKTAVVYSLLIISFFSVGLLLGHKNVRKKEVLIQKDTYINLTKIGVLILMVSLPVELYLTLDKISTAINDGYIASLKSVNGILSYIASLHLLGVALLIMSLSYKRYLSMSIYLLYMLYAILSMVSGGRIYQTIAILVLGYICFKVNNFKINIKISFLLGLSVFFLAVLFNTLADFRDLTNRNPTVFFEILKLNLENNPTLNILEEFGATIYTVCLSILFVPSKIDFSYGVQYVTSFVTLIPNLGGTISEIIGNTQFTRDFDVSGIGGSFIGEIYSSFKFWGCIFALLIGILLQKFSLKFELYLETKNFIKVAYFVISTFWLFLWVRGYFTGLVRGTIWTGIILYILINIFSRNKWK